MTQGIEIDGKTLLPIKEVVSTSSYSRDYITKLARDKKIEATFVGRQWFVETDSLKRYSELSAVEQELRKHQLSAERKREKKIHAAFQAQSEMHERKIKSLHSRALAAACLVLGLGLLGGGVSYGVVSDTALFKDAVTQKQYAVPAKAANTFALQTVTIEETKNNTQPEVVLAESVVLPTDTETVASIQSLGNVEEGILLLPRVGTSSDISTQAFSDNVEVRVSADGTESVVRVDAEGNQVGNPIQFVRVPVVANDSSI
jgi:hypothetical protein